MAQDPGVIAFATFWPTLVLAQAGLGQAVLLAARSFRPSELFAGTVRLGALGSASNALPALAERRLLRWQRR